MYYSSYIDVVGQGVDYLDAFVRDYYRFIKQLDAVISLDAFAKEWKCIPTGAFARLMVNDKIYIKNRYNQFDELVVTVAPGWSEEEEKHVLEAKYVKDDLNRGFKTIYVYNCGDAYFTDSDTEHTPTQYRLIHSPELLGGNQTWPIKVITTKTKEPTS